VSDQSASLGARELNHHAWFSLITIGVLVLGVGGWALFTELTGAVIAGGTLVVESSAKRVQHQEGGIVAEILAGNEDRVEAGQVLVRLDDTMLKASLAIVENQLNETLAIEARLLVEVAAKNEFELPLELLEKQSDPVVARLISVQRDMLRARKQVRLGGIAQLGQQITQLESQLTGLKQEQLSLNEQLAVTTSEHARLSGLLADQLVDSARVNDLVRENSRLTGELGSVASSLDEVAATIAERRIMVEQVDSSFLSDALDQLQTLRQRIAELTQQKVAGQDRLRRVDIIAPQTGVVHESIIHTVGGVVAPGETLMLIVPTDDRLVIEVRLNPLDVDKVSVGQKVIIRIPGLNARTTPDLPATITQVAPDLTRDPQSGISFFVARVALEEGALGLIPGGQALTPGMPAEAFIQTGNRTVMSYLMEPLSEQFRRAMRED
jgi:HlyD family secretion protein